MHKKKGGKGVKKKSFNKRMNLTEEMSTEMANKNLIMLRENKHIITIDKVLQRHRTPTEEINVIERKFGGNMYDQDEPEKKEKFSDKSAKAFNKEFGKVVEAADIIIEVLDARDPMGTRCKTVENGINLKGKKLVLLLNKSDLVPRDNLRKWLHVLKKEHPTVVFKASTQLQAKRLGRLGVKPKLLGEAYTTSMCLGADTLMQLLRNIRLSGEETPALSVGVIGMPNVGKSSVINSLKRSRACNVGGVPGITKHMQEVKIDSKISLIDSPGLIFATSGASDDMYALKNAVNPDSLEDPITPVDLILNKAGYDKMSAHYKMSKVKTTTEFLAMLAKRRGKLLKQGIPNINAAATIILNDWNSGKIKYYTEPPNYTESTEVNEMEEAIFSKMPNPRIDASICLGGPKQTDAPDAQSMDVDEVTADSSVIPVNVQVNPDVIKEVEVVAPVKKPRWETKRKAVDVSGIDLRKHRKKDLKRLNKERRRNLRRADEVSDALEAFGGLNDDNEDGTISEMIL